MNSTFFSRQSAFFRRQLQPAWKATGQDACSGLRFCEGRRYGLGQMLIGFLLIALTTYIPAQEFEDLLEPERAFAFSAKVVSADQIAVTWQIAPGYYMYADKFHFESDLQGVALGEIIFPPTKIKRDEFFGDVEILEGTARIMLELERTAEDTGQVNLTARGQGCNEPVGVCYPPMTHTLALTLLTPSEMAQPLASTTVNSVTDLRQLLGAATNEPEFLNVDEAFHLDIKANGPQTLSARFTIAPGYYLYQDKLSFLSVGNPALADYNLPGGKTKNDPYFGDVSIYSADFAVDLALARGAGSQEIRVDASYQGCAEKGICYPPVSKSFTIALPQLISAAVAATPTAAPLPESADDAISGSALAGYLAVAFGTGLLLSFTPCVLPLIPILLGSVVGQSGSGRLRGATLSVVYVLGTTVTYAAIGAVAGATGDQLQAYFQNIWAIGTIALILVLMALSMFGLYNVQLPSALQTRLSVSSQRLGGSAGMIFVLGALSALIVGACVSPLLISVLSIAILHGDPWLGAALMSALALGMGVILIAAGAGASYLIPRNGLWMERVKQIFGVMLLGVAIYLLGVVPDVPVLLLWAALFIITAVYLGATRALPEQASGLQILFKGMGTVLLVWGVLAMIGGFSGNRNILAPVSLESLGSRGLLQSEATITTAHFTQVDSLSALDNALMSANVSGHKVLLDFYADWCTDCIRMEESTFRDPGVIAALAGYRLLQVDVTDPDDPKTNAIKKRYGVFGPPAMLFFNANGDENTAQRLYGYKGAEGLVALLKTL